MALLIRGKLPLLARVTVRETCLPIRSVKTEFADDRCDYNVAFKMMMDSIVYSDQVFLDSTIAWSKVEADPRRLTSLRKFCQEQQISASDAEPPSEGFDLSKDVLDRIFSKQSRLLTLLSVPEGFAVLLFTRRGAVVWVQPCLS